MDSLPLTDVDEIICLLAEVGDPTVEQSIAERKQKLLNGVCRLIGADVYLWSVIKFDPEHNENAMPISIVDGGWSDDAERFGVLERLSNAKFVEATHARVFEVMQRQQHATIGDHDVLSPEAWQRLGNLWTSTGFERFVLSLYPLGPGAASTIGFHRRVGRPPFSERDRLIIHMVLRQVDWLHRYGADVPAGEHVLQLSPRERQVMLLLMHGDSQKEIAHNMKLSVHTVGNYLKSLHKHFGVSSRAELLSKFIAGSNESPK